jgi:hypothetical protein
VLSTGARARCSSATTPSPSAAKKAAPAISLGTLFVAVQLADLAWPVLVLAGVERFEIRPGITAFTPLDFVHYPYSHSLVALAAWGTAMGVAYCLARRAGWRAGFLLAALVVSHWVLDFVSHRPDMPITLADYAPRWDWACGTRSPRRSPWNRRSSQHASGSMRARPARSIAPDGGRSGASWPSSPSSTPRMP